MHFLHAGPAAGFEAKRPGRVLVDDADACAGVEKKIQRPG